MAEKERQPTYRDGHDNNRVYMTTGRVAHTVWSPMEPHSTCRYCGKFPDILGPGWLGTGSQEEYDHALTLPYCKEKKSDD